MTSIKVKPETVILPWACQDDEEGIHYPDRVPVYLGTNDRLIGTCQFSEKLKLMYLDLTPSDRRELEITGHILSKTGIPASDHHRIDGNKAELYKHFTFTNVYKPVLGGFDLEAIRITHPPAKRAIPYVLPKDREVDFTGVMETVKPMDESDRLFYALLLFVTMVFLIFLHLIV